MSAKKYSVFKNTPLQKKQNKADPHAEKLKRAQDKSDAERLIKAIASKLNDPELAKKAALIIEDMVADKKK